MGTDWQGVVCRSCTSKSKQYLISYETSSPVLPNKVHADQLRHVKKGCLERRRQDIAADGSRIEGSHKAWNSIQQSHASGLEMFLALAHDFVLRWNVNNNAKDPSNFIATTHGCHHLRLCDRVNTLHNSLVQRERARGVKSEYTLRATFPVVDSGESFGLTVSNNSLSFGGLLQIKEELDNDRQLLDAIDNLDSKNEPASIIPELKLDPNLLLQPLPFSPSVGTTLALKSIPESSSTGSAAIAHALIFSSTAREPSALFSDHRTFVPLRHFDG